jgi:hypothetical protein
MNYRSSFDPESFSTRSRATLALLQRTCLAVAVGLAVTGAQAQEPEFAAAARADQFWGYLDDYCTDCHNFEDFAGSVDFTTTFAEDIPTNPELFEKVVMKLNGRMMPPPNRIRPDENRTNAFVGWLEGYLDEAGAHRDAIRHMPVHRLNRKEYGNAIRDLFGLEINPAELLPADDMSDGFDNIADALRVSPAFIDQYVTAARVVSEQVVGDPTPTLGSTNYIPDELLPIRAEGGGSQQAHIEGLPLGTRGGMLIEHWFPVDGEYAVSVGDLTLHAWMFNIEFENKLVVTIDNEQVYETVLGGDHDRIALDLDQGPPMDDINGRMKDIRFTTTAGPHKVGVTFVRRTFAESDDRLQPFLPGTTQDRILNVPSVEVRGPFVAGEISSTPTRDKLFSCYPENADQERSCAEQILAEVATQAYRRPLTDFDMAPLMQFYDQGDADGGFEEGMRRGLTRLLASPNFLYRAEEPQGSDDSQGAFEISSLELASRLSFFLWSSLPDEELLQAAISDRLKDPNELEVQVRRMLADPRSASLAENFAYQWLKLSKLDELVPDIDIFPYAAGAGDLRPDFKEELSLFIDSVFREDQSVLRLLDADYSFLNERLALHYGINNVKGSRFRRVELEDPNRWGLLGKGGVLSVTAYPNRTSPVLRGAWILEVIMGTPPPVPPPNVEALPENEEGKVATTVRERLEQHRENPTCNACHSVMDPLGFALDNFDATGRWRDIDRFTGSPVDASGLMPNGSIVEGPEELRAALLSRPELFARSLTQKLMTYALGRTVEAEDMPTVRQVVRDAADDNYRFSALVMNIINSDLFRMNRATELSSISEGDSVAMNSDSN